LTKLLQFAILCSELKLGFFTVKFNEREGIMRNFIVVAVFVAILTLAFETTGYSEKSEEVVGKTAEGISFEELKAQDEKLFANISDGFTNIEEAVKIIDECIEFSEEVTKMQNAEIEKMLREMEEGREEYEKVIEKYFSSSDSS